MTFTQRDRAGPGRPGSGDNHAASGWLLDAVARPTRHRPSSGIDLRRPTRGEVSRSEPVPRMSEQAPHDHTNRSNTTMFIIGMTFLMVSAAGLALMTQDR